MNIFVLDLDPQKCAQYHCDKHVVKMIIETAQLLSTAHHVNGVNSIVKDFLYKKTHENHPCAKWARISRANYKWLSELGLELCKEYTHRYGKIHKTQSLMYLLANHYPLNFNTDLKTIRPLCMPDKYHGNYAISSYRNYYINEKKDILKYTNREKPHFVKSPLGGG